MDTVRYRIGSGRGTRLQAKDGTRWALMRFEEHPAPGIRWRKHRHPGGCCNARGIACWNSRLPPVPLPNHQCQGCLTSEQRPAESSRPEAVLCRARIPEKLWRVDRLAIRRLALTGAATMEGCGNPNSRADQTAMGNEAAHLPGCCLAGDGCFRPSQPKINISGSVR
jgi:hypothetical protein